MNTKSIEKIIKLIVKLGLFFAHCDGSYSAKERSFISHFVEKLADMGNIDDIKDVLGDSINKTYTLDEVKAKWINGRKIPCIFISATKKENIDKLRDDIYKMVAEIHAGRYPFNNFLW